jgi:hypothetical protein
VKASSDIEPKVYTRAVGSETKKIMLSQWLSPLPVQVSIRSPLRPQTAAKCGPESDTLRLLAVETMQALFAAAATEIAAYPQLLVVMVKDCHQSFTSAVALP